MKIFSSIRVVCRECKRRCRPPAACCQLLLFARHLKQILKSALIINLGNQKRDAFLREIPEEALAAERSSQSINMNRIYRFQGWGNLIKSRKPPLAENNKLSLNALGLLTRINGETFSFMKKMKTRNPRAEHVIITRPHDVTQASVNRSSFLWEEKIDLYSHAKLTQCTCCFLSRLINKTISIARVGH